MMLMRAVGPTDHISRTVLGKIARRSSAYYDQIAAHYRQSDLREHISTKMWGKLITEVTSSFTPAISVLDLGCGTGRYIHCVKNAGTYIGVDASRAMLDLAKDPIRQSDRTVGRLYLLQADIHNVQFRRASFDFVFSVGVLGDCAPLTMEFCNSLKSFLRPGGKALLTVMDARTPHWKGGWKRKIALMIYPFVSTGLKSAIKVRMGNFKHTEAEVRWILEKSGFASYKLRHTLEIDPNHEIWDGFWFICEMTMASDVVTV